MGGSEGRRSATSIVAADAGRAHRSFRLTPPGRFGPFGAKCPGCSIIRTFLTVVLMVSLPRYGSLCHLRWQVSRLLNHSHFPDGRAHGFAAPLRVALPPSVATAHRAGASLRATGLALPSAPQGTRFPPSPPNEIRIQRHVRWIRKPCAARFPCTFPRPRRRRRGNVSWRKRSPQASFFDTPKGRTQKHPSLFSVSQRLMNGFSVG